MNLILIVLFIVREKMDIIDMEADSIDVEVS